MNVKGIQQIILEMVSYRARHTAPEIGVASRGRSMLRPYMSILNAVPIRAR
jgi:hypothetical protein